MLSSGVKFEIFEKGYQNNTHLARGGLSSEQGDKILGKKEMTQ